MTFTGHEDNDSLKPYIAITDKTRKNLWTRFRGAALAASRCRPRGSLQPFGALQPSVLRTSWLFPPPSPGRKHASAGAGQRKQPAAYAAGCMVPKGLRRGRDLGNKSKIY